MTVRFTTTSHPHGALPLSHEVVNPPSNTWDINHQLAAQLQLPSYAGSSAQQLERSTNQPVHQPETHTTARLKNNGMSRNPNRDLAVQKFFDPEVDPNTVHRIGTDLARNYDEGGLPRVFMAGAEKIFSAVDTASTAAAFAGGPFSGLFVLGIKGFGKRMVMKGFDQHPFHVKNTITRTQRSPAFAEKHDDLIWNAKIGGPDFRDARSAIDQLRALVYTLDTDGPKLEAKLRAARSLGQHAQEALRLRETRIAEIHQQLDAGKSSRKLKRELQLLVDGKGEIIRTHEVAKQAEKHLAELMRSRVQIFQALDGN